MTALPRPLSQHNESAPPQNIAVIGATGLAGDCLLPLLTAAGWRVAAYYRRQAAAATEGVEWLPLPPPNAPTAALQQGEKTVKYWICAAPIWVLPEYFTLLESRGARRLVALSSTSRFTKTDSSDPEEQAVSRRLADAEARVRAWAEARGVEWVILRPTLIYGLGRDKNIVEIARFIRRFGFFPLFGKAQGLRQPVHVRDVAEACVAALESPAATDRCYNLSGSETLTYREMISRVFAAMDRLPLFLPVPLLAFRTACALLRLFPRYRHWSPAMAERMNRDMVFDHGPAAQDLGFQPRGFTLSPEEV